MTVVIDNHCLVILILAWDTLNHLGPSIIDIQYVS